MYYVKSIQNRYGRVQLICMELGSMREARWSLHLDDNNRLNPETNGWVVRMWLELTDNPESCLILREDQFDTSGEVRITLPRYAQAVVDSEYLFHGAYHMGPHTRYALITSFESAPHLDAWIRSQLASSTSQSDEGRSLRRRQYRCGPSPARASLPSSFPLTAVGDAWGLYS